MVSSYEFGSNCNSIWSLDLKFSNRIEVVRKKDTWIIVLQELYDSTKWFSKIKQKTIDNLHSTKKDDNDHFLEAIKIDPSSIEIGMMKSHAI